MKLTKAYFILPLLTLLLNLSLVAADFQAAASGPAPPDSLPDAVKAMIQSEAVVVKNPDGKVAYEFWMRTKPFEGEPPMSGFGIRFDNIPAGAFLGVVRLPNGGSDFREQSIEPGVYTMRFSLHPEDGNHMGVAASRDFAVLIKAEADTEPAKNPAVGTLVQKSNESVGNPHPTILRVKYPEGDKSVHIWEDSYGFKVLDIEVAEEVMGVVVHGHSEE